MFRSIKVLLLGMFAVVLMCGQSLAASSGVIRLEMPDAAALGKGSAFVGQANRSSAVYYNPAGITQLGTEISVGATVVQPRSDYEKPGQDTVQMRSHFTAFPHVYFATPVVKDKFYVGLGESSNWGLGSDWNRDTFNKYSCYKSSFENKDYMVVGAYKLNDQWSFALGADNDDSKMEKDKKLYQAERPDGNLQMKAKDNAWGFRVATMYKVNEKHQFGLMYRSPIHHTYTGKVYLDGLIDSALPGAPTYNTNFGGSTYETRVETKFVLPQSIVLGYSFRPTQKWTLNADVEWLDWSSVKEQIFSFPDSTGAALAVLNTGNPQNRDWKSVFSTSLGAEYAVTETFRLRGGYMYHQTPIGNDTFDTAFNDSSYHALSTGFGYDLSPRTTIDLAYAGAFFKPRKVSNDVDTVFGADLDGKYKTFINVGTVTLTYKF